MSKLKDVAADLSALIGAPVPATRAGVAAARAKLTPDEAATMGAAFAELDGEAGAVAAEAPAPVEPGKAPASPAKPSAQRVVPNTPAIAPKPTKAPVDPLAGFGDEGEVWQLLSGPNRALSALSVRQGDMVVRPSEEVKAAFRGCQRAKLTIPAARALLSLGRGRLNRKLSAKPAEAVEAGEEVRDGA